MLCLCTTKSKFDLKHSSFLPVFFEAFGFEGQYIIYFYICYGFSKRASAVQHLADQVGTFHRQDCML